MAENTKPEEKSIAWADDDDEFDDEDEVEFGEENYTPTTKKEVLTRQRDPRPQQARPVQGIQPAQGQDQKGDAAGQEGLTSSQIAELEAAMAEADGAGGDNQGYRNQGRQDGGYDRQKQGGYNDRRQGDGRRDNRDGYQKQGGYNDRNGGGRDNWGAEKRNGGRDGYGGRDGGNKGYRDGGGRGDFNKPRKEKFDQSAVDPNSNYRKFYCNDSKFFAKIIGQEEGPYEFKIHLFPSNKELEEARGENDGDFKMDVRNEKINMMKFLDPYGAEEIDASQINDARGAKLRILFTLKEQDKALELYNKVSKSKYQEGTDQVVKIFYLKQEHEFEKYADEEAKNFYEEEAKREEEAKANRGTGNRGSGFDRKAGGHGRDGGGHGRDNYRRHDNNDAVQRDTGISFGGAKPVFTATKPKTNPNLDQPLESQDKVQDYDLKRKVSYQKDQASASHRSVHDLSKKGSDKEGEKTYQAVQKIAKTTSLEVTTFESPSKEKSEQVAGSGNQGQGEQQQNRRGGRKDGDIFDRVNTRGGRGRGRGNQDRGGHQEKRYDEGRAEGEEKRGDRRGGRTGRGRGRGGNAAENSDDSYVTANSEANPDDKRGHGKSGQGQRYQKKAQPEDADFSEPQDADQHKQGGRGGREYRPKREYNDEGNDGKNQGEDGRGRGRGRGGRGGRGGDRGGDRGGRGGDGGGRGGNRYNKQESDISRQSQQSGKQGTPVYVTKMGNKDDPKAKLGKQESTVSAKSGASANTSNRFAAFGE